MYSARITITDSMIVWKRLRMIFAFLSVVCFPTIVYSAPQINQLKGFTISAPDTISQGSTFAVIYVLEATHWENAHIMQGSGITMSDAKPEVIEGSPYHKLMIMARFSASRLGSITLPPMSVEIDGQEVLSEAKEVFVKPNSLYGEEMTLAHEWLLKKGANKDSLSLNFTAAVGDFYFFCDQHHKCFCLVAKKDLWEYAGSPIWAYSLESAMDEESLSNFTPYFFYHYIKLLSSLKESGQKAQQLVNDMGQVPPLLGELRWGQGTPYNVALPSKEGKRVIVGCVPLTMAMIMKYHNWPKQGASTVFIEQNQGPFNFDCKEIQPKWEQYKDDYKETEAEECADLSKILSTLALLLDALCEDSETAVSLNHVKHIMCNNLGYSGRMSLYEDPACQDAYKLLKQEIANHCPCIVSNNTHAFICDGYEDGFFHYNMGWRGHGNGYFRAIGQCSDEKGNVLFRNIITGIEPQHSEGQKEITLRKAGTLDRLLTNEDKENLTSLTIRGSINSSDIRLIRVMAGVKGDTLYNSRNMGTLRALDLTNATISKDKTPYRVRKATNSMKGSSTRTTTYTYGEHSFTKSSTRHYDFDFNNMDKKKWIEFKRTFAAKAKKKGSVYSRISDTEYMETSFCVKNTIGAEMFADCSSLNEIKVPLNTKAICDYAFMNCSSIQEIQIPASVTECGKFVFQDCLSLEKIHLPITPNEVRGLNSGTSFFGTNLSPGIKVEQYQP